jgi:DNA-directed RNA polymerase subunit RPC12/RpoP
MALKSYKCRFCGEPFVPTPSAKPGYIDECPECFHARTHPTSPVDVISKLERGSRDGRRALNSLRRYLIGKGIRESEVDERIAKALNAD